MFGNTPISTPKNNRLPPAVSGTHTGKIQRRTPSKKVSLFLPRKNLARARGRALVSVRDFTRPRWGRLLRCFGLGAISCGLADYQTTTGRRLVSYLVNVRALRYPLRPLVWEYLFCPGIPPASSAVNPVMARVCVRCWWRPSGPEKLTETAWLHRPRGLG